MTGPRPLARLLPKLTGKALGRHGQAYGTLLMEWSAVVGPELGARSTPVKLSFPAGRRDGATLTLRTHGGAALEFQHAEPQVLERINGFFGFAAVARIRLVQAPPRQAERRAPPKRRLTEADEARIRATVEGIEDEELREAMLALGRAMAARGRE
ncbi:DUF721 domain-containing protein [Arenibaculum sp.]|jgi:hypothetical protein|uniref:DUF721 domain-containing protein n=1 Tax=Arenibaculum sp. TaxID=2865862 RepID=UPI002E12C3E0|nr:DciA family protein [Arenibaculum sp.]